MSNSPFINSVQPFAITVVSNAATGTYTVNPGISGNAFILWGGETASDTSGAFKNSDCVLSLAGNLITATRAVNPASLTATVYGTLIDATSNLVSSVQYGSIAVAASSTSGTATISSVNTAYSAVFWLGTNSSTTAGGSPKTACPTLALTNATTVTATTNSANSLGISVNFCVVQFNSAVIKSNQVASVTSTTSTTTDSYTLPTAVVPGNAIVAYGGTLAASTNPATAYFYANLASSTSLSFVTNTAASTSRTHAATVIEFIAGIVNVQRGVISIASTVASNTATLGTSVDTTISALNYTGYDTSQTADDQATGYCYGALTNATTVTGGMNSAGSTNNVGYEVISFKGGTITEATTATDGTTASNASTQAITEATTATDAPTATNASTQAITEAVTALDSLTASNATTAATTEATTATDATTGRNASTQAITEAVTALDSLGAANHTTAAITEATTATDTVNFISGSNYTVTITESATATDNIGDSRTTNASVSETGSVSDAISASNSTAALIAETMAALDAIVANYAAGASVTESLNATDLANDDAYKLVTINETGNALDSTDSILITPPTSIGVNFNSLIAQIANTTTYFPLGSVGYVAHKKAIVVNQKVTLPLPACYVHPISMEIEHNKNLGGYFAKAYQTFGITVVISNTPAPQSGQIPMQNIQGFIEQQIMAAVGNFIFDPKRQARGCFPLGYSDVDFDGAHFYFTFEYEAEFYLGKNDVWMNSGVPLTQINAIFANGDVELGATVNPPQQ